MGVDVSDCFDKESLVDKLTLALLRSGGVSPCPPSISTTSPCGPPLPGVGAREHGRRPPFLSFPRHSPQRSPPGLMERERTMLLLPCHILSSPSPLKKHLQTLDVSAAPRPHAALTTTQQAPVSRGPQGSAIAVPLRWKQVSRPPPLWFSAALGIFPETVSEGAT